MHDGVFMVPTMVVESSSQRVADLEWPYMAPGNLTRPYTRQNQSRAIGQEQ